MAAPSGRTPALVTAEGAAIGESAAIAEYLEETAPNPSLLPGSALERAEARRLAQWFDTLFFEDAGWPLLDERILKKLRGGGGPDVPRIRAGAANVRRHLDYVAHLAEARRWLAGDSLSIADFAAAAHLSVLDYSGDVGWDAAPPAKDWYARVKSRPAFRPLLADRVTGLAPAAHYTDLDF